MLEIPLWEASQRGMVLKLRCFEKRRMLCPVSSTLLADKSVQRTGSVEFCCLQKSAWQCSISRWNAPQAERGNASAKVPITHLATGL